MPERFEHGPRLELFRMAGELWCRASGFERPAHSAETLELLHKTRTAFHRMGLARAEIEAAQLARKARERARRMVRV